MKIKLDLPDWVDERHIRLKQDESVLSLFAGIELVAIKDAYETFWKVKVGRCNMCGDCCTGLTNHFYPTVNNGECIHLDSPDKQGRRRCKIPISRSRLCDNDPRIENFPRCTITYNKIEQK